MRGRALVVLAALGALAQAAAAAEHLVEWAPRVFALRGSGDLEIRATAPAHIKVAAGADGRIKVSGSFRTGGHGAEAAKNNARSATIDAAAAGDRITVDLIEHGGTTFDLLVEVPARATVKVRGKSGAIEALRLAGSLDLVTRNGPIHVTLAGPASIRAQTDRGRIEQDLGLAVQQRGRGAYADGKVGGGGNAQVTVATGQGPITLHAAN
jgi:hypothetical protein